MSLSPDAEIAALRQRVAALEKINRALIARVERGTDEGGAAFDVFQTAITLEKRVRDRTQDLERAHRELEQSNRALVAAKEAAESAALAK